MNIPKFDPKELTVLDEIPGVFDQPPTAIYDYPIPPKEAVQSLYEGNAGWQMLLGTGPEFQLFTPLINPDNIARAFAFEASTVPGKSNLEGGKDMFGIDWEYIPSAGGSMVRPGTPFIKDANELKDSVVWPDIDSWDWEGARASNKDYLTTDKVTFSIFLNGFYERLISFMDFENAIVALVDEDQEDAVKEFMDKLADLYIKIFDKYLTYFPEIDLYEIHDDWGGQKSTFFSPKTAKEMLVPYMRKVTDYLHSKGKFVDLHSCGSNIKQVANYIDAGFDSWNPQSMNDSREIYNLYGDKILIATMPEIFDPATTSDEEQKAIAKKYVDEFCDPDKPSTLSVYSGFDYNMLTPVFREEIYKQSRIKYCGS